MMNFFDGQVLEAEEESASKIHKNLFKSGSSSKENGNAMLIEARHNKLAKYAEKGQYTTMPIPKTSYDPKRQLGHSPFPQNAVEPRARPLIWTDLILPVKKWEKKRKNHDQIVSEIQAMFRPNK